MTTVPRDQLPQTDDEWRARLTPEQFEVARKAGTERAFTGEYWDCHDDGVYRCAGCGAELFDSATKFESGTGWPSFYEPVESGVVSEHEDRTHGMVRTEAQCANCGAHLGHVFIGEHFTSKNTRHCVNSMSMDFIPDKV